MSYKNSRDDDPDYTQDDDIDMDLDREQETVDTPVSAGTRSGESRGEAVGALPGPACSKLRRGTRTRSGSASSGSSRASSTPNTPRPERRARKGHNRDADSSATARSRNRGEDHPTGTVDSDGGEDESRSPDSRGPPAKKRLAEEEDGGRAPAEAAEATEAEEDPETRGRGRPQTTGMYAKRAESIERCNRGLKERTDLQEKQILLGLSAGQVFSNLERQVDDAVEELRDAPTPDVANQARTNMAEVVRIAKISKNLQGGCVKTLKHAAVMGAAATEVLRNRAEDSESENEASRQAKEMRRQLDALKKEMQAIRERAEKAEREVQTLREQLAASEARSTRRRTRRRGPFVD